MRIGFIYDPDREIAIRIFARYFESVGIEVVNLPACICNLENNLSDLKALFMHVPAEPMDLSEKSSHYPCHSGVLPTPEESCPKRIERIVEKNPQINFYFLEIVSRGDLESLSKFPNVNVLNRSNWGSLVDNPKEFLSRKYGEVF